MFIILNIWTKYGKSVILPVIVIGLATLYFLLSKQTQSPEPIHLTTASEQLHSQQTTEQLNSEEQLKDEPLQIVVDVKGAVKHPGVYPLTTEHRIIDAIEAAGGYVADADTRFINHAQKLVDEFVIYVPKIGEEMEAPPVAVTSGPSSNTSNESKGDTDTVNLNTATESELMTLSGVGPSKAAAIIAYREENGPFQTIEDLKKVSGIGEKTFERLQPYIAVK
ncbi:MAG: helix-hairpin-helix domain-containing protein [Lysinibacillus sp.]